MAGMDLLRNYPRSPARDAIDGGASLLRAVAAGTGKGVRRQCVGQAQREAQAAVASIEHRAASSEAEQEAARQQTRHAAHDSDDIAIAVTCT